MSEDIVWIRVLIKVSKVVSVQSDIDGLIVLTTEQTWEERFTAVIVTVQPVIADIIINIILCIYHSH